MVQDIGIEDDFDVDSEDLDGELIDALLEVLKGGTVQFWIVLVVRLIPS